MISPSRADLYILIAGLLLGLLLGPAVLGRATPQLYDRVFERGAFDRELADHDAETARLESNLLAGGVSSTGVEETLEGRATARQQILAQARWREAERVIGLTSGLVLALLAVMVIEAVVARDPADPEASEPPAWAARLPTVRYGLIALWLMLVLAQPLMLGTAAVQTAAAALVIGLLVGLVPLAKRVR